MQLKFIGQGPVPIAKREANSGIRCTELLMGRVFFIPVHGPTVIGRYPYTPVGYEANSFLSLLGVDSVSFIGREHGIMTIITGEDAVQVTPVTHENHISDGREKTSRIIYIPQHGVSGRTLEKNETITLKPGDRIRLGHEYYEFILEKVDVLALAARGLELTPAPRRSERLALRADKSRFKSSVGKR